MTHIRSSLAVSKMKYSLLFLLFLILIGCSSKITEEDLIGGYWIGTAGYQDGKPEGEPYCLYYVIAGLEFKDEETVYVEGYEKNFEYVLEDGKNGMKIIFSDENHYDSYYIDKVSENEIGLVGGTEMKKEESCYLEQQ